MSECEDWTILPSGSSTWTINGVLSASWTQQLDPPSEWTIIQKVRLTWGPQVNLLWGNCRFLVWLQN